MMDTDDMDDVDDELMIRGTDAPGDDSSEEHECH